ncbi:hypothetical protein FSP39_001709 [Pinctada imbricata]|uniref:Uncharacterized protein n=1 Tax=Pinctada imbricata TaxID=66713 RepID=A0AA88XKH6_PINIB|nr:hypothetical protein FSP39_001709 [Pinctada imbricata]
MCVVCVMCQNKAGNPNPVGAMGQTTCSPACKPIDETCVKLSRCIGKQCHMCAETTSVAANFKCPTVPSDMGMGVGMDVGLDNRKRQMQAAMQQVQSQMMNKAMPTTRPTKETGIFGGNPMTDFLFLSGSAPDYMYDMMGYGLLGSGGSNAQRQLNNIGLYNLLNRR